MTDDIASIGQFCPALAEHLERKRQEAQRALDNPEDSYGLRLRPGSPVLVVPLRDADAEVRVSMVRGRVLVRMVDRDNPGAVSLTNSAERATLRVLQRLRERVPDGFSPSTHLRIFYWDSMGRWDEMVPKLRYASPSRRDAPGGRMLEPEIGFRAIDGENPTAEPRDVAVAWLCMPAD
jgi:hypothetical protein